MPLYTCKTETLGSNTLHLPSTNIIIFFEGGGEAFVGRAGRVRFGRPSFAFGRYRTAEALNIYHCDYLYSVPLQFGAIILYYTMHR